MLIIWLYLYRIFVLLSIKHWNYYVRRSFFNMNKIKKIKKANKIFVLVLFLKKNSILICTLKIFFVCIIFAPFESFIFICAQKEFYFIKGLYVLTTFLHFYFDNYYCWYYCNFSTVACGYYSCVFVDLFVIFSFCQLIPVYHKTVYFLFIYVNFCF